MDQNPIILGDSNKTSSNMDLHPNKDELKGSSELPIKASSTKGINTKKHLRKYEIHIISSYISIFMQYYP